jgi:hypothetical protein
MRQFEATVQLTGDDVAAAARHHYLGNLRFLRWAIPILGILIVLIVALVIMVGPQVMGSWSDNIVLITALTVGIASFWGNYAIFIPRAARRQFEEQAGLQGSMHYSWDEQHIRLETKTSHANMLWTQFHASHDAENVLQLYLSRQLYWVIPKRYLQPDCAADLLARLEGHAVPARNKRK